MEFGICTDLQHAAAARQAGWDYVEASARELLKGQLHDTQWTGDAEAAASPLPVRAANLLVPETLKITGPDVDAARLHDYMATVCRRAQLIGIETLTLGSAGARGVPDGFDHLTAANQIIAFAKDAAPLAAEAGITLAVEPLRRAECNIINTIAEAQRYVNAVDHPGFQITLDTYHLWSENEPVDNVRRAIRHVRHVHVADLQGRVAPGESGSSDYRAIFKLLRQNDYTGRISVEGAPMPDFETTAPRVLAYLRQQWDTCV